METQQTKIGGSSERKQPEIIMVHCSDNRTLTPEQHRKIVRGPIAAVQGILHEKAITANAEAVSLKR